MDNGNSHVNKPDPQKVKSHFDDRSETYSDLFDSSTRTGAAHRFQSRRQIVGELATGKSGRLLECAAGTGEVTLAALRAGDGPLAREVMSAQIQRGCRDVLAFLRQQERRS